MIGFFRVLGMATNICAVNSPVLFGVYILLLIIAAYLLGSVNSAIIVSKYRYNDDIRKYGSGNAGLTNMNRVYGGSAAALTFFGDVLKQVIAVFLGVLMFDQIGAYIAGLFCMLGHIAPVFYKFRGGKGVLTAATMVLLIDWQVFLVLLVTWVLVLLLSRYVSLASIMAAFAYPAVVYYAMITGIGRPEPFSMICAMFVGCVIIFMHRENIKRLFNNQENKFSFKRSPSLQEMLDKEDPENDKAKYAAELRRAQEEAEHKKVKGNSKKKKR